MKFMVVIFMALFVTLGYLGVKTVQYSQKQSEMVDAVQALKKERDKINAEWTQLLLEQKMLADDAVINRAIREGLDMHLPQSTQVVYLN
ncbi:cell division protein FtsL [Rappaport israeli]|uniref:cell division protein FtsL n=1 Tax=Rappaport israeli TaxID=1839807 RepID=UPI000931D262|nr:cell division protein FtsL [Rappaport israeli]